MLDSCESCGTRNHQPAWKRILFRRGPTAVFSCMLPTSNWHWYFSDYSLCGCNAACFQITSGNRVTIISDISRCSIVKYDAVSETDPARLRGDNKSIRTGLVETNRYVPRQLHIRSLQIHTQTNSLAYTDSRGWRGGLGLQLHLLTKFSVSETGA